MSIEKTDNQDVTKPGEVLTYEVNVKNTGDAKLGDLQVTDIVPQALEIIGASSGGDISGHKVTWGEFALEESESIQFTITARVKDATANGHTLVNTVKVKSDDEGVSATDVDTTVVEREGQVAATVVPTSSPAPAAQSVPVTAATGTTGLLGMLMSLVMGAFGLLAARPV